MKKQTDRIFFGRETTKSATCPFCGLLLEKPKELETRRPGEMPVGTCSCGAVYAFDASGHNLGSAFIEALVFGCNMDWDLAWSLFPEEDYLEGLVEHYDIESNLIIPVGYHEGRKIPGALSFVRLHQEIREVTSGGVQKKIDRAAPATLKIVETLPAKRYSKKEIEELVRNYQVDLLLSAARQDKKIIRNLQRLLYSSDDLLRLRAADLLGKASAIIAQRDPGSISTLLQGLFNSVSDTASSCWGAIDAIGEILGSSPDIFLGYIPAMYRFLDEKGNRPRVIRAIGRTAESRSDLVRGSVFRLISFLQDPDPQIRGQAAWLFGHMGVPEARPDLEKLLNDLHEVKVYINGNIEIKPVGQLAAGALEAIDKK
ncbi:MAG: DVU0298 family protein [Desulfocucumaceae bacterium]